MPLPTSSMMHQNRPLENMVIAVMQEDDSFILMKSTEGAMEEVDHKSNTYYVFDEGDWNRMEMQRRGPAEESEGSGWRLSTDSYACDRYACHKDWDTSDVANADEAVADTTFQADSYLSNQVRIFGDYLMSTEVFTDATWTDDLDGTTGAVTEGTNFLQWDDASSDPQGDIYTYSERMSGRIGVEANTMIVGAVTHRKLLNNDTIRDQIKYTEAPTKQAILDKLAAFFGVESYFVARSFRNTAAEGATKSFSYICDSKAAWIGHVAKAPGKYQMSAYKLFAYKNGGRSSKGITINTIDMPWKTAIRHEIETFWDVKVVAADAGCFFDAAVA